MRQNVKNWDKENVGVLCIILELFCKFEFFSLKRKRKEETQK